MCEARTLISLYAIQRQHFKFAQCQQNGRNMQCVHKLSFLNEGQELRNSHERELYILGRILIRRADSFGAPRDERINPVGMCGGVW